MSKPFNTILSAENKIKPWIRIADPNKNSNNHGENEMDTNSDTGATLEED